MGLRYERVMDASTDFDDCIRVIDTVTGTRDDVRVHDAGDNAASMLMRLGDAAYRAQQHADAMQDNYNAGMADLVQIVWKKRATKG